MRGRALVLAVGLFVATHAGFADVWDLGSDNDNTALSSDSELVHGLSQMHDLGALAGPTSDLDFYVVDAQGRSSYEVLIDGPTGDLNTMQSTVVRLDADTTTVLQSSDGPAGIGFVRGLRWINSAATVVTNFVRVGPAACTTMCTADDQYRIRFYDTTVGVARYNNSGTQTTVLLIQNTSHQTVSATAYYWTATGVLVNTSSHTLDPKQLAIVSTSAITGATSGSITIANTARYGYLNVKAVALEPSTGFSFDTPGVYKPY